MLGNNRGAINGNDPPGETNAPPLRQPAGCKERGGCAKSKGARHSNAKNDAHRANAVMPDLRTSSAATARESAVRALRLELPPLPNGWRGSGFPSQQPTPAGHPGASEKGSCAGFDSAGPAGTIGEPTSGR